MSDTNDSFKMIDVSDKLTTKRRAIAEGKIGMSRQAFETVVNRKLPKGDALMLAEVAGVMAAKRTPDTIPLCHPIQLDKVLIKTFPLKETSSIVVQCIAVSSAKTGVEMEALSGVNAALLAIYDLTKGICPALTISDIRLHMKEGGKSGNWVHPDLSDKTEGYLATTAPIKVEKKGHHCASAMTDIKAVVLTISDRGSRGETEDTAGPIIEKFFNKHGAEIVAMKIIPDEQELIEELLTQYSRHEPVDIIITTGGTGLSPRDVTPEAVESVCDRLIPGIGEQIRAYGMQNTERACLSRSVAGLAGQTVIVALPGSPAGVKDGIVAMHDYISHAIGMAKGGDHAPIR